MILKLIGGILIFSACSLIGIAAANKYSMRPKDIRRLRSSIQLLETEIVFGCTPLPQAFQNISNKLDGPLKSFYKLISEDLMSGFGCSLTDVWNRGIDSLLKETALSLSDGELINNFGKVLGISDRNDQKKHFELFYIQLKQNEDAAEDARRKNEKMYKSLGFLSGIVIFILLV